MNGERSADAIVERVRMVAALRNRDFKDVYFENSGSGVPLTIAGPLPAVRAIRLSLEDETYLNLDDVRFLRADGPLTARASVALSSDHKHGARPAARTLALPDERLTIHSAKEPTPWAVVDLSAPHDLAGIEISNRAGDHGSRSWSLRLETTTDGTEWQTVFRHRTREAAFADAVAAARRQADFGDGLDERISEVTTETARLVLAYDYAEARRYVGGSGLSGPDKTAIIAALNSEILAAREREWITHGIKRSFRFWTEKQKTDYLAFAKEIVADLQSLTPNVCFGFGTCLAMVRDGDFIKHDDDVDIIMLLQPDRSKSLSADLEAMAEHLRRRGYTVRGGYASHRHVSKRRRGTVDVFVGVAEGDDLTVYPAPRRALRIDEVFPPAKTALFGVECPVPKVTTLYLERVYGPNWRTPMPRWRHRWDRSRVSDLTGPTREGGEPAQSAAPPADPSSGRVETVDRRSASGWVPMNGEPVRVSLCVNGKPIISTWAVAEEGAASTARMTFRLNYRQLWDYVGPGDRITIQTGEVALPIAGHGAAMVPETRGPKSDRPIASLIQSGYVFNQKGKLQLSKLQDHQWQAAVVGLYAKLRDFMRQERGLQLFACYGTMLGAVRQGTFIGHDHDFDSAYVSKARTAAEAKDEFRQLGEALIRHGFGVSPHPSAHWVSHEAFGSTKIDVFHLFFDGDGVLRFPFGYAGSTPFTTAAFSGYSSRMLGGRSVDVIENAGAFLATVYGSNWQTPNPGFHWAKDRKGRATAARLDEAALRDLYWEDHYARTAPVGPSPFQGFVAGLPSCRAHVVDLGCGGGEDAAAFAESGRTVLGLDRSRTGLTRAEDRVAGRSVGRRARFTRVDLGSPAAFEEALTQVGGEVTYYARSLLDHVPQATRSAILATLARRMRPGDSFAIEFRTAANPASRPKFLRHLIDADQFCRDLTKVHGLSIDIRQDGNGFARPDEGDPILCRLVGRKEAR